VKLPEPIRIGEPGEWEPVPKPSGVDGFTEDASGLLLPEPRGKAVRQMVFRGGMLNVSEEQEEIHRLIDAMRRDGLPWVQFTEGAYGTPISVPADAIDLLLWIQEAWIDIEGIKEQMRQQEMAQRLTKAGIGQVSKTVIPIGGMPR
jgi:hypothetical protein